MTRLRLKRGEWSQKVAAAMCDMKQPMYARYESGATLPSAEQLFRLCVAFGCSADYLLGLTETTRSEAPATVQPSVEAAIKTGDGSPVAVGANAKQIIYQAPARPARRRRRSRPESLIKKIAPQLLAILERLALCLILSL